MPGRLLLILILLTSATYCYALEGEYAVSKIPAAMLRNASAVVRLEDTRFEILSLKETVLTRRYVVTILNESGDELATFEEFYDKFVDIASAEGILYDANGKQIKKVKKKDMEDLSDGSDDLMSDNRFKRHDFYWRSYPYTVEYKTEIVVKGSLFFPKWTPQNTAALSIEQSNMIVVCPSSYQFRYKAFNYTGDPIATTEKGKKIMTWQVSKVPAVIREPYSPAWHEITTEVIFGPTDFQIEDYKGNMTSWQDLGKFTYALKQGRDKLPENVKQSVHDIADKIDDPIEKISLLYQFMQKHTRYVSIQLGIGGWQPFDASFVSTHGYGDCKALSNYMFSILKEAGITSYYTLIRAGRNDNYITEDFPSNQFNHVILCVPLAKDTVWLECTSQTLSAGYLSEYTANRYALLIDEQGGKLVRTPVYGKYENQQIRKIAGVLRENGGLELIAASQYKASKQDAIHDMISHLSRDKVKEYLRDQLDFATYDISKFEYQEKKSRIPVIDESLTIEVSNYATVTGKRLFVAPNTMTRSYRNPSPDSTRRFAIQLGNEFTEIDTVTIVLPAGYKTESIPQAITLDTKFGKYTSAVEIKDGTLHYYRRMEQSGGRFPASDYDELVKFYQTIYKADRNRVVLVRE